MTSGGDLSIGVEKFFDQSIALSVDGDTSTEGSTSPDLILSDLPTLNVNAPAFTSVSSMTPVIITKNVEIGNERWKPNATVVEENVSSISLSELPQPFIGTDGLYYWPTEVVNNFPQTVVVDTIQNGTPTAVVSGHETQIYSTQVNGPTELANHGVQTDSLPKDIPHEELKRLIQLQFEYYFSRENLANDSYLVSQMDGDQYVPISTVAKFNQVRKLTSNMDLIVEALKESPYVQLDETEQKVRANMKRCIVILREIPESTPMEEVKALFSHPNCPQWVTFEFALNDSWYVTFDCEDDAKKAYRYLREEVQNFRGRPLMARIKAKTLLSRTVYLPKSSSSSSTTVTVTTPTESTAQFTPPLQPISTFTLPPNAVFHQPQSFPFYATAAPVNGNPLIPGAWIAPRQFVQQEMRPKNNYKHNVYMPNRNIMNGQRSFYKGSNPRHQFRNNYNNHMKVPMYERNGAVDSDERIPHYKRNGGNNTHIPNNVFRKEDPRYVRNGNSSNTNYNANANTKKDYRGNVMESPRFQRLRERRVKDEPSKSPESTADELSTTSDLALDLALENFPALPSPNSPNESDKSASSLKELASNALQLAQEKLCDEDVSPTSASDLSESSTDEMMSTSSIMSESLLMTTTINNTNAITSQSAPKISYAQMAQKPNKNPLSKEGFEGDNFKDLIVDISTSEIKKNTNSNNGKSETKSGGMTPRSQRRSSKGSPRTQRSKTNQETQRNEKLDKSTDDIQNNTSNQVKETYASKFGKGTQPKSPRSSFKGQSNNRNAPGSSKVDTTNLPPPRPLMSQIIKPPESKLNEIVLASGQNEQPGKSFSETVKAITTDDIVITASIEKSTIHLADSNKENINE